MHPAQAQGQGLAPTAPPLPDPFYPFFPLKRGHEASGPEASQHRPPDGGGRRDPRAWRPAPAPCQDLTGIMSRRVSPFSSRVPRVSPAASSPVAAAAARLPRAAVKRPRPCRNDGGRIHGACPWACPRRGGAVRAPPCLPASAGRARESGARARAVGQRPGGGGGGGSARPSVRTSSFPGPISTPILGTPGSSSAPTPGTLLSTHPWDTP